MLRASTFRELVSGRKSGPAAKLLRGALRLAEFPYTWVVNARNRRFDDGWLPVEKVSVPVVGVGNLTLGGTGKTPMVQWLAHWFQHHGLKVSLISRGYKSAGGAKNDEARELEQQLPGVAHWQNPDRVAAARVAIGEFGTEVIILDDAFQHRRIARDLDIVLIDALEPFGFGHVFPRGTLREPLAGLARAQVVILTRADMVDETERSRIRGIVEQHAPLAQWAECRHAPLSLLAASGNEESLSIIRGRRIGAFCGLGNPAGFRHTLEECHSEVAAWREYPDHFAYASRDIEELNRWASAQAVDMFVCTHKDLVKLPLDELGGKPLRALVVGMEFLSGHDAIESKLQALLEPAAVRRG
jgi:tetraacyldisaccharide 4'-kinase